MGVSLARAARWLTIVPTLVVSVIVLLVLLMDRNQELTVAHGGLLVLLGPVLTAAVALCALPWCFAPVHVAEPTGPAGG